jgi:hypothetical protein
MVEESQQFSLPNNRLAASAKQILQRKRPTHAMGGPIHNGDAGNSFGSHQFSRAAAGPVGIGKQFR